MFRDRDLVEEMIKRAAAADFEALVFTVDLTVLAAASVTYAAASTPPQVGLETIVQGGAPDGRGTSSRRSDPLRQRTAGRRRRLHRGIAGGYQPADGPKLSWDDVAGCEVWDGPS
jgi:isopentenyl diphosphate isomerase/L-lactate dehydrogenase-like FMN-dependent dehydrogenase